MTTWSELPTHGGFWWPLTVVYGQWRLMPPVLVAFEIDEPHRQFENDLRLPIPKTPFIRWAECPLPDWDIFAPMPGGSDG